MKTLLLSDFDYPLPEELIAQQPLEDPLGVANAGGS